MAASRRSPYPLAAAPWRGVAGVLAALILGLSLAAVSPKAHAWIHGGDLPVHAACEHNVPAPADTEHSDHVCAVVLFASGIELPVEAYFTARPCKELEEIHLAPDSLYLAQPRYLRQPERGPPVT